MWASNNNADADCRLTSELLFSFDDSLSLSDCFPEHMDCHVGQRVQLDVLAFHVRLVTTCTLTYAYLHIVSF